MDTMGGGAVVASGRALWNGIHMRVHSRCQRGLGAFFSIKAAIFADAAAIVDVRYGDARLSREAVAIAEKTSDVTTGRRAARLAPARASMRSRSRLNPARSRLQIQAPIARATRPVFTRFVEVTRYDLNVGAHNKKEKIETFRGPTRCQGPVALSGLSPGGAASTGADESLASVGTAHCKKTFQPAQLAKAHRL